MQVLFGQNSERRRNLQPNSLRSILLGYTFLLNFAVVPCNESSLQRQIKGTKFRLSLDLHVQGQVRKRGTGKVSVNGAHHLCQSRAATAVALHSVT